jgi:hypothetical protein
LSPQPASVSGSAHTKTAASEIHRLRIRPKPSRTSSAL